MARVFNSRGNAYDKLKQYDEAIVDYTEAIRLKPDDASAFQNREIAYDALGETDMAECDRAKAKKAPKAKPISCGSTSIWTS